MENCNTMAPDIAKRLGVIGKNEIEEAAAAARTEQYKRKKRYYHAKQFSGVEEGLLDSFLYDESCKNNNFTVVSVIENPNYCYYTVVYYVEE